MKNIPSNKCLILRNIINIANQNCSGVDISDIYFFLQSTLHTRAINCIFPWILTKIKSRAYTWMNVDCNRDVRENQRDWRSLRDLPEVKRGRTGRDGKGGAAEAPLRYHSGTLFPRGSLRQSLSLELTQPSFHSARFFSPSLNQSRPPSSIPPRSISSNE